MSSFYGGGAIVTGGSGTGTTDYSMLTNTPVTKKDGTSTAPVVLSTLPTGLYVITGECKTTPSSTSDTFEDTVQVYITKDTNTGNKVAQYTYIEDGVVMNKVISYNSDGTFIENDYMIDGGNVKFYDAVAAITAPEQSTLYIVDNDILHWDGDKFVKLGVDYWKEF